VGLGWSLQAGGLITRIVKGLPDEKSNGFCGTNNVGEKAYQPLAKEYVSNVSNGSWDGEPDMFYFNFMGNSGAFILSETGLPVFLPHSNFKLVSGICGASTKWILTDEKGVIYTFGGDDNSKETTSSKITGSSSTETYVSSWYLSEIKAPSGEAISFTYLTGEAISYKYYVQYNETEIRSWGGDGSNCVTGPTDDDDTKDKNVEISIAAPRYLDQITSSLGKIKFNSIAGREDQLGRYLNAISLFDYNNNFIEEFKFVYDNFISDGCSGPLCKRLKLNKVTKSVGTSSIDLFSFQYNTTNLPARDSHAIDHWGFFNSNSATSKIPTVNDSESPCGRTHDGADRTTDSLKSRANILTKIFRPTGGFTEFIYAVHQYKDEAGNNQIAGGARIRIVKDCTSDTDCKSTYYYYKSFDDNLKSSGVITTIPKYHFRSYNGNFFIAGGTIVPYGKEYLIRKSQSLTDLFTTNGSHITYTNVTERVPGNGYVRNYFTNTITEHISLTGAHPNGPDDHCDLLPEQFQYKIQTGEGQTTTGIMGNPISPDIFPYTPKSSKSVERGILTDRRIYSESNKLLLHENYQYKFDHSEVRTITGYKAGKRAYDYTGGFYYVGKYNIKTRPYTLEKSVKTIYDQTTSNSDLTSKSSSITEYAYDLSILLPTTVTTYNPNYPSQKSIVTNKYVNNPDYFTRDQAIAQCETQFNQCYSACFGNGACITSCHSARNSCLAAIPAVSSDVDAIHFMNAKHQWSKPVEVQTIRQTANQQFIVNASVTKFVRLKPIPADESTHFVLAKEVFSGSPNILTSAYTSSYAHVDGTFKFDVAKLRKITSYDSYDLTTGNVLSFKNLDGIPKVATWGYNNNHLLTLTANPNNPTQGSPDVQHQKSYDYKPLVGLTRETDANNRNARYEYNSFGALLLKRDNELNITHRYRANFVNSNQFGIDFTVTGPQLPNNNLTYTVYNDKVVGETKYVWDFGDGQVLEGSTTPVYHSYLIPGTYAIKLAKVNPEYGSIISTKQVTIYSSLSVSVSSTCSSVDLCYNSNPTCTVSATFLGCSDNLIYTWYYRSPGGNWFDYGGSGSQVSLTSSTVGSHDFKCVVTSGCGQPIESTVRTIYIYRSNPNCPIN
jgi:YD repeat-containing protein